MRGNYFSCGWGRAKLWGSGMRWGSDFIRVGAVGIRIRKMPQHFSNSWAGGKI
ncbi:hypothetical protein HMPREF1862_01522 [Varibaculum cambriense]|uniref:Uncharacterized protein n=1 Tax=Varibaculum cambriense TaxID=184870 RepID=A0AB34WYJ3_9ACTO|nr:hypothetical protein HMPREF1862_01522 [Varibaculum cambriense]